MILPARITTWFFRRKTSLFAGLVPYLLTWSLLAATVAIVAYSLEQAAWVPDSSPLVDALGWGLVFGVALASSRFWGRVAAAYHFFVAFLMLGLWIGKILPSAAQLIAQPLVSSLDLANIRLLSYLDRLISWVTTFMAGKYVQDNGLFVLLIGLCAWGSSAWLAWAVIRRQRALDGLLPVGLLLGVNTYLSGQEVDALWLFTGCVILLAARTTMIELSQLWDRRQVDYPDELGWNWIGAALGLGLIILFAARLSPVLGTPDGWKTLGDFLRDAQKRMEDTTSRLFGDVALPAPHPDELDVTPEPSAPSAETPQMGMVGPAPFQSSALVMWVKTSDPPPTEPVEGMSVDLLESGLVHYWRSNMFGKYTGTGWEGVEIVETAPAGALLLPVIKGPLPTLSGGVQSTAPSPVVGRYWLSQEFEIVARHGEALFAASVPSGVEGAHILYAGPDSTPLVYGSGVASKYAVQSWAPQATDVMLRAASGAYPAEIASLYLQLPLNLPQRVRDLARRVVGEAATPFDKAVRIQDYLRLSYPYDLQVPPPPSGRDVVDYFLFDSPGGFCSYYSSAMVVMLRSQGVAARVASGYATGSFDFTQRAYRVTPSNAHAWVEVYFPGYGWIEFEPTAGLERIRYETPGGTVSGSVDLPPRPIPPAPAWQGITLLAVAILALIVLFGLTFWLRAHRRRLGPGHPPERLAEIHYLRLRRLLAWAGIPAPLSTTPAEYLDASAPVLEGRGRLPVALAQATAIYQRAVYSAHPPSYEEIDQARHLAWQGWGEWAKLLLNRFWQRIISS
jgi:transglutaminase-like putative cysteine protease